MRTLLLPALLAASQYAIADEPLVERSARGVRVVAPVGHEAAAAAALAIARAVPGRATAYFGRAAGKPITVRLYQHGSRPRDMDHPQWRRFGLTVDRKRRIVFVATTQGDDLRPQARFAIGFGTAMLFAQRKEIDWYAEAAAAVSGARAAGVATANTGTAAHLARQRWLPTLKQLLAPSNKERRSARAAFRVAGRAAFLRFLQESPLADRVDDFRRDPRHDPDAAATERLFHAWLRRSPAAWEHEAPALTERKGMVVQGGAVESAERAWRSGAPAKPPYAIRGTLRLQGPNGAEAAVLLARRPGSHIAVRFRPRQGIVVTREGDPRTALARAVPHRCRIRENEPVAVAIHVLPGQIAVSLRGTVVATALVPKTDLLDGSWGLLAGAGSVAHWSALSGPGLEARPNERPAPDDLPSIATLSRQVRTAKDAAVRQRALDSLSRHGPKGWAVLASIARRHGAKRPERAAAAIRALADGGGEERTAMLLKVYRRSFAPSVRRAVLDGLVPAYPEPAAAARLLHAALADASMPGRVELLERLRERLPAEVLRTCLGEEPLAQHAYEELRRRKLVVPATELAVAARWAARRGHSLAYAQSVMDGLARNEGWELVAAIALLVEDPERVVARGAYVLMLRVSGKDQPADPDLWRSWVAARRGRYERPDVLAPGVVAAAIVRGADVLRADLLADGYCSYREDARGRGDASTRTGATGLAVLALRAAGVPSDDSAIRKALATTLAPEDGPKPSAQHRNHTYAISILAMALAAVDPKKYEWRLQQLANALAAGQLQNGQWTYRVGNGYEARARGTRPTGDNSNTQYAMLGLRAAAKAGAKVRRETWQRALGFWKKWQLIHGKWTYTPREIPVEEQPRHGRFSMTAAGISSVALCLEGLHGAEAGRVVRHDETLRRALRALGRDLLDRGFRHVDHYNVYGVERACILTGTRRFNGFDWYRQGALALVRSQRETGEWIHDRRSYGPAIDTAYALLFLRRATTPIGKEPQDGVVKVPPRGR